MFDYYEEETTCARCNERTKKPKEMFCYHCNEHPAQYQCCECEITGDIDTLLAHAKTCNHPFTGKMYKITCVNCKFIFFSSDHNKILCEKCITLSKPENFDVWIREIKNE